jgi:poly-gamma-glutamate capsule biosynthesis protein CapA/YwtB (metallophosphatase superfamily)
MRSTLAAIAAGCSTAALAILLLAAAPPSASLAFAGDVMLGRDVQRARAEGGWERALSALVPITQQADAAFANLESPLTHADQITTGYDLRADPQSVKALIHARFTALSLANNHALDAGRTGLRETTEVLQAAGLHALRTESKPERFEISHIPTSWFAFDDTSQRLNISTAALAIEDESVGNLVVVSIHWGREYECAPTERQRALAMEFASAGADLIIGHHPHVLQHVEWIWGRGRGRPTLVAYSLGNALFDQVSPPGTRRGALLTIDIGAAGWRSVCAFPFRILPSEGRVAPANGTEATYILKQLGLDCVFTGKYTLP